MTHTHALSVVRRVYCVLACLRQRQRQENIKASVAQQQRPHGSNHAQQHARVRAREEGRRAASINSPRTHAPPTLEVAHGKERAPHRDGEHRQLPLHARFVRITARGTRLEHPATVIARVLLPVAAAAAAYSRTTTVTATAATWHSAATATATGYLRAGLIAAVVFHGPDPLACR
jgi:hypothetical protein